MILVLLGPPGSGKGTQAKVISAERKWPQLSTGDMLRTAISQGTQLGSEAKTYMDKGSLVPDSVVIGLIRERMGSVECESGFILDGFPRTITQAEALDQMLEENGRRVDEAILFEIPDDELVSRMSGRRTCVKCGSMYHVVSAQPKVAGICDKDGTPLVHRDDDHPGVIQKRLGVYHQQTAPLTEYYRRQGKLLTLDARRPPAEVTSAMKRLISE